MEASPATPSAVAETAPFSTGATGSPCSPNSPGSHPATSVNFKQLTAGQKGTIVSLSGNAQDVATLAELGMCRGTEINVIRQGKTAIVRFNSQELCLRLGPDVRLMIQPTP